jgi:CheY-like chemotaxis protein
VSLVGSLEDLALSDILQIVSLSRKSGILSLTSGEKKGTVIFRAGQVVCALSNLRKDNLGTELVKKGIITSLQLKDLLTEDKAGESPGGLNQSLIERLGLDPEVVEEVAKDYIKNVVFGFFDWDEGNFNFELKEKEEIDKAITGPLQYTLASGLNPQFLAMDGTRLKDEKAWVKPGEEGRAKEEVTRDESLTIAETQQPESTVRPEELLDEKEQEDWAIEGKQEEAITTPPGPEATIVLIDDDPLTLSGIREFLGEKGYQVRAEGKSVKALEVVRDLIRNNAYPLVVADLIMPKIDGSGMLGGIELLSRLKLELPEVPVILMTDHRNEEAERKAWELGVDAYLNKPKKSKFRKDAFPSPFAQFGKELEDSLGIALQKRKAAEAGEVTEQKEQKLFDIAVELKEEFAGVEGIIKEEEIPPITVVPSPGLAMLRSMITEMSRPDVGGEIMLLILRFASELMNRAVIFLVKKNTVCGLGEFGINLEGEDAEKRVRQIRIPLSESSIFKEVWERQVPVTKKLEGKKWDRYIVEQLGGEQPEEVFVAPIFAGGRVAVMLYGDNVPEKKEIGETVSLEIFLAQAGLAMDRALLERKLKDLTELQKGI